MGLVALQHVGSSWNRARIHVPCIGRQILNHCATREVPSLISWLTTLSLWQRSPVSFLSLNQMVSSLLHRQLQFLATPSLKLTSLCSFEISLSCFPSSNHYFSVAFRGISLALFFLPFLPQILIQPYILNSFLYDAGSHIYFSRHQPLGVPGIPGEFLPQVISFWYLSLGLLKSRVLVLLLCLLGS